VLPRRTFVKGKTLRMGKTVSIKLGKSGKLYDFDSGHFVLKPGDRVIVNTEQGRALGMVCDRPRVHEENPEQPERELKQSTG